MVRRFLYIITCIIFLLLTSFQLKAHPSHAFYVSIMEISWEENVSNGQILFKIFMDDLGDAIYYQHKKHIAIPQNLNQKETIKLISDYIHSHVSIKLDGELAHWEFEKAEALQDAVFVSFRMVHSGMPNEIYVQNNILTEIFDTQTNIIRFDLAGQKRLLKLDKKNTEGIQRF